MIATQTQRQINQNASAGMDFEAFLYSWNLYIRAQTEAQRTLTEACVTLHVRARCLTVSDMVSSYGTKQETQGIWCNYDPTLDGESHPINIVGPAFTTNKNACLQSNSATMVTPANQSALMQQVSQKWQRVADFFERMSWNESKRAYIFDDIQKGGTILIDTFCKEYDRQSVPKISGAQNGLAVYQCQCGSAGMQQVKDAVEGEQRIQCPKCGQPAEAMVKPIAGLTMGEGDVPTYDIVDEVISFFNFTADVYNGKVGGIQTMNWLQIQKLRDLVWMQTNYSHLSYTGPANWSYPLRCDYALARGRWQYFNQQPTEAGWGWGHEKYEVKDIYLHEDAYASYIAPQDFEFINVKGKKAFKIREGQTIMEAQRRQYGENCQGFKFVWQEDRLLGICGPEKEELNLRNRFSDVHWSRESGSYLSSPNYSLVFIQDDMTLLNTLNHNIIAANAFEPVFYNSTVFEQGDFSKQFIGTKNAALLDPEADIRKYATKLPMPTPSPYLQQQMQWLWGIKDSISMTTDAMRGQSAKGEPYAKARQDLETSYGNLTSVLKSFAQCKNTTFLNKARLAKKVWTLEQFQRVGSMFGEQWGEQDVEEMTEIDLDRDLIVSYKEGSEMPATPMSKELQFFGALQQLGGIIHGLDPKVAMQIVTPEKWAAIVEQIGEMGGMDFDVSGLEIDEVISQKRFISLQKLCKPFANVSFEQVAGMKEQVVATEAPPQEVMAQAQQLVQSAPQDQQVLAQAKQMLAPHQITAFDLMMEKIIGESGIRFSEYEDLDQQQKFFVEQLRAEMGKEQPNEVLRATLETLLGAIGQQLDAQKKATQEADPQYQAMVMQKEESDKAHAAEMAKATADAAMNDKKLEIEGAKLDLEKEKVKIAAHDADRNAMLDLAKHVSDSEEPDGDETEPDTKTKVSESISYKDAPPSVRRQMEIQAGMKPATGAEGKVEMDAKKQEAKPKPVTGVKPKK